MYTKVIKTILKIILLLLLAAGIGVSVVWVVNGRPEIGFSNVLGNRAIIYSQAYKSGDRTGFASDALYLVSSIEAVHPIFAREGRLNDDYFSIRDDFLEYSLNNDISRLDFAFAAALYIKTLRDGHMNAALSCSITNLPVIYGGRLEINWRARGDELYLLDENNNFTLTRIISIGGIDTAVVFETIEKYFYFENESDRIHRLSSFSLYGDIIEKAGGVIADNAVLLTFSGEDGDRQEEFPLVYSDNSSNERSSPAYIVRYRYMDGILLIDLRTFADGLHITETVNAIQLALQNGYSKFIIDLRGNTGGNSLVGQRLLEAMGLSLPSFGSVLRLSDLSVNNISSFRQYRRLHDLGVEYISYRPNTSNAKNPNNVFVSVLTDSLSYSSSLMTAVWIKDGGFGNIIGSPSSNSPTSFGNWAGRITLPFSNINAGISSTQWLRPDINADQYTLWPDIMIDPSLALDTAIEFLHGM